MVTHHDVILAEKCKTRRKGPAAARTAAKPATRPAKSTPTVSKTKSATKPTPSRSTGAAASSQGDGEARKQVQELNEKLIQMESSMESLERVSFLTTFHIFSFDCPDLIFSLILTKKAF